MLGNLTELPLEGDKPRPEKTAAEEKELKQAPDFVGPWHMCLFFRGFVAVYCVTSKDTA